MAELHYFPLLAGDWLSGEATTLMTPEQEGAFVRLLCHAWLTKHQVACSLPDDDKALAQLSRLGGKWKRVGALIKAQFKPVDGSPGRLRNRKQWAVYEVSLDKHQRRVVAGREGAKARAELKARSESTPSIDKQSSSNAPNNARSIATNNAGSNAPVAFQQSESESESESETAFKAPKREKDQSGASSTPQAHEKALPRDRFLDRFYPNAPPERRAEVVRQLDQALTPEGVQLSRGVVVHAKDAGHLNRCISAVLRGEPPKNPDRAIVIVLKKLGDLEKDSNGHTAPEAASAADEEQDRLARRYRHLRKNAVERYAREHVREAETAADLVRAASHSQVEIGMRLEQELATMAAFPDFDTWLANLASRPHAMAPETAAGVR